MNHNSRTRVYVIGAILFGILLTACSMTNQLRKEIAAKETTPLIEGCDQTPRERQWGSGPYYTGPLIDTHLHMPSAFQIPAVFAKQADWYPPVLDKDISKSELVCVFDQGNVKSAFGFYLTTNVVTGTSLNSAEKMEEKYAGRIVPFLMSPHILNIDLTSEEIEEILQDHQGLFKGLGEIAFYRASYKGMSPEDPKFLKMYDLAKNYHLIVMIHPDEGQRQAVEGILQKYPEVTFLFHGSYAMRSYVAEIVAQYPNAYFTVDTDLFETIDDPGGVSFGRLVGKEKYIADLKREYEKIQQAAIARWKEAIEAHPDKFLWGTDRAELWHLDPEVSGLIVESSRAFIGQLDPSVQEKFAYQNAERLITMSGKDE